MKQIYTGYVLNSVSDVTEVFYEFINSYKSSHRLSLEETPFYEKIIDYPETKYQPIVDRIAKLQLHR